MTVSDQIIEVLDALCDKFGVAVDWTSQNVIPYIAALCEKFITYEIATSIFWMCVPLVLLAICIPLTCMFWKKANALDYGWNEEEVVCWFAIAFLILTVVVSLWAIIGIPVQIHDIIEVITFPEKTIFEYISNLLRTQ